MKIFYSFIVMVVCAFITYAGDEFKSGQVNSAKKKYAEDLAQAKKDYEDKVSDLAYIYSKILENEIKVKAAAGDMTEVEKLMMERKNMLSLISGIDNKRIFPQLIETNDILKTIQPDKKYFGTLGNYTVRSANIPYIFLMYPNGNNVYNKGVIDTFVKYSMNVDSSLLGFTCKGYFECATNNTITFESIRSCQVIVDGNKLDLNKLTNYKSSIDVKAGVHEVELIVGNNGGQLGSAKLMAHESNNRNVQFWFTGKQLSDFLASFTNPQEVKEVSGWKP